MKKTVIMIMLLLGMMFTNILLAQDNLPKSDIGGFCYQKMGTSNLGVGLNVFMFNENQHYGGGISGGASLFSEGDLGVFDVSLFGLYRLKTETNNSKQYTPFFGVGVGYLKIEIDDSDIDPESYNTIIFSPMIGYGFGNFHFSFKYGIFSIEGLELDTYIIQLGHNFGRL